MVYALIQICYYHTKHWLSFLDEKNKLKTRGKDTNDFLIRKNSCSLITGIVGLQDTNWSCCW